MHSSNSMAANWCPVLAIRPVLLQNLSLSSKAEFGIWWDWPFGRQKTLCDVLQLLLHPSREVGYCDQFVCLPVSLSVCLSVREHISGTTGPIFPKFVVQIPCGRGCGVAIRYVLLVLWMMSRSALMGRMAMRGRLNLYFTTTNSIAIPGQSLMFVSVWLIFLLLLLLYY